MISTGPKPLAYFNFLIPPGKKYVVKVTTGNQLGAGTDADVFITIYGSKRDSKEMELKGGFFNRLKNNFERGK